MFQFPGGGLGNQNPARTIAHSPPGVEETLNYWLKEKSNILIPGIQTSIFLNFYKKIWKYKNRSRQPLYVASFYDNFYGGSADRYSARRERERPTSGKSSWLETLYVAQLLRYGFLRRGNVVH